MKKNVFLYVLILVAVVAITATATWAWFTGTDTGSATITTATIGVDEVDVAPINLSGLLPGGDWKYAGQFKLVNTGTAKADLYMQMVPENDGEVNFCFHPYPTVRRLMSIKIDRWNGSAWETILNDSICKLYPVDPLAYIPKLADDVNPDSETHFKVYLYLDHRAGNEYAGQTKTDPAMFIAVQHDAPAPVSLQGSMQTWPEGDANYDPDLIAWP